MWEVWITQNDKYSKHDLEPVKVNKQTKLLLDVNIQLDHIVDTRRLDVVVVDKAEKNFLIVYIAIPGSVHVHEKEKNKSLTILGS